MPAARGLTLHAIAAPGPAMADSVPAIADQSVPLQLLRSASAAPEPAIAAIAAPQRAFEARTLPWQLPRQGPASTARGLPLQRGACHCSPGRAIAAPEHASAAPTLCHGSLGACHCSSKACHCSPETSNCSSYALPRDLLNQSYIKQYLNKKVSGHHTS